MHLNSKSKKAKMDEFVTITIGIDCLSCGVFKPVRGWSLPQKVKRHVSAEAILDEALKKRMTGLINCAFLMETK